MVLGSAFDVVDYCGVARFYFVDFPLGNPCGKPYDLDMQRNIIASALLLFESATEPRTAVIDSHQWGRDEWRIDYMALKRKDRERLLRQGEERRRERQSLREMGHVRQD